MHQNQKSLDRFLRTARKFGFRIHSDYGHEATEKHARDLAEHLMQDATEGDHQRFIDNLLSHVVLDEREGKGGKLVFVDETGHHAREMMDEAQELKTLANDISAQLRKNDQ